MDSYIAINDLDRAAAIQAATAVFLSKRPNVDLNQYKIDVIDKDELVVVLIYNKDRKPGTRGGDGFEVTLKRADHSLVKAHFAR